jgi:hypothetical protein
MSIDVKEMVKAVDDMREALPIITRFMRAYYNELILAGFCKHDALLIVINHGVFPGGALGK